MRAFDDRSETHEAVRRVLRDIADIARPHADDSAADSLHRVLYVEKLVAEAKARAT